MTDRTTWRERDAKLNAAIVGLFALVLLIDAGCIYLGYVLADYPGALLSAVWLLVWQECKAAFRG